MVPAARAPFAGRLSAAVACACLSGLATASGLPDAAATDSVTLGWMASNLHLDPVSLPSYRAVADHLLRP